MQEKCPKCGEALITKTIKKELGEGSIDYPVAQICPKCNWNKDLTGASDIVSKPVTVTGEIKKDEKKPPTVPPPPPKTQPKPGTSPGINKIITAALAILVLGGLAWVFFFNPSVPEQVDITPTPTPTPQITQTQTYVQPTSTQVPEVTPTGNKIPIKLDSRRGFLTNTKTIKLGDEVIWENSEAETVTLVSNDGLHISYDGLFDSQTLPYGRKTSYLFKKTGTYDFNLKNTNFIGTIIVEP
jgi:plastocyanin